MSDSKLLWGITLRVVLLFCGLMAVSFFTEWLQAIGFFEDHLYTLQDKLAYPYRTDMLDKQYDWGYRHYVYFWMGICLFILTIARIVFWVHDVTKPKS